jgi:glycosyltransferase involved in cell wall biosynthesis
VRLLMLTRYGHAGPSSRVRLLQYRPALEASGAEVTVQPLLDDDYVRDLYESGRRRWLRVGSRYLRRVRDVLAARRFDLVWLEKECWPWLPASLDPGLLASRAGYAVDYDDAVFHHYDQASSRIARALFAGKIDAVMRRARLVTAGNQYLAARARAARAAWIEVIPSVVDLDRYALLPRPARAGFVVGWIGSPATQHFLEPLVPILRRILDPARDRFVTIGARFAAPLLPNHEMRSWSEASEASDLAGFDVGVMPLLDRPFERGKCGFKLIQYMAAGLPVVASPVGVNTEIVSHGVNGFLAGDAVAWEQALASLRDDPALCRQMGARGRAAVEDEYCLQVTAPRLVALLERAVRNGNR